MVNRNRILANILLTRLTHTDIAEEVASVRAANGDALHEVEVTVMAVKPDLVHKIEAIAGSIKVRVSQGERPVRGEGG